MIFEHKGVIYFRPCGRGVCIVKTDGEFDDPQFEDRFEDGYYEAELRVVRKLTKSEAEKIEKAA